MRTHYFLLICVLSVCLAAFTSATPTGAGITTIDSETAPVDGAGNASAVAGNVSELMVRGYSTTQSWQGYFGNVSGGAIRLGDASNAVFYNWSLVSTQGEVFASTNQTISWATVQCFNFTAQGNLSAGTNGESSGATNLFGLNLSQLETRFNLSSSDADGVNETFSLLGSGTHDLFFVASQQFSEGECPNTRLYSASGSGVSNQFEETLLYEPASGSVIFTALLENDVAGFDSAAHDFELLVLENGHGGDTSSTSYYFFTELG